FIAGRLNDGNVMLNDLELVPALTRKARSQFLTDQVNDRLKSALAGSHRAATASATNEQPAAAENYDENRVVTTEEELEGFFIVKSIIRGEIDSNRIVHRDTQSYFGVLIDDNNRKPVCRLHFNRSQKYIGLFDSDRKETRHPISNLDEIFQFSEQLKEATKRYL